MSLLDILKTNRVKVQGLIDSEMNKIQITNQEINDILPFIEKSWSNYYKYNDYLNKNSIRYKNINKYYNILEDLDNQINHLVVIEDNEKRIKIIDEDQMKYINDTIFNISKLSL
jgi:regulator of sigma D